MNTFKGKFSRLHEFHAHAAWAGLPRGTVLKSISNAAVEVLSPGIRNNEAGPDFLSARLSVDGKIISGDVELHDKTSDWAAHGHDSAGAYSNVALHVVRKHDLKDFDISSAPLVAVLPASLERRASGGMSRPGDCAGLLESDEARKAFAATIDAAGLDRFRMKSDAILRDMISIGSDMAFLRRLLDAAGFKRNRPAFAELFARVSKFGEDELFENFDVLLWGESSLLPDVSDESLDPALRDFAKSMWDRWWKLRRQAAPALPWNMSSTRPQNTPERRLAAVCAMVAKSKRPLAAFWARTMAEEKSWRALRGRIASGDKLWDNFRNFRTPPGKPSAVIGEAFALELAVNALAPAAHAYARLTKDENLEKAALSFWAALPPEPSNNVLKKAAGKFFGSPELPPELADSSLRTQGVHHLHNEYCKKNSFHCPSCPLFQSLDAAPPRA